MYLLGLLPFVGLDFEVGSLGFITRNYHDSLLLRSWNAESNVGKIGLKAFLFAGSLFNWVGEGLIENLNKRGIHTCYWVLNENDEISTIRERSTS